MAEVTILFANDSLYLNIATKTIFLIHQRQNSEVESNILTSVRRLNQVRVEEGTEKKKNSLITAMLVTITEELVQIATHLDKLE